QLRLENKEEVDLYIEKARNKSERERISEVKEKTGVELKGIKAINPANQKEIPVFIADYVLGHYGTGAVMAVPAHDERDFDFAKKYNLEIIFVVDSEKDHAFVEDGILFNSEKFNGLKSHEAREKIGEALGGRKKVNYKLRDWVFSRQRYWGEPIPIIHCEKCGMVPDYNLPVELPYIEKYEPTGTGESPLSAIESFVNVKCPKCGGDAKRETNTMPQWAGSSWYYLRFIDPKNNDQFVDLEKEKFFMPIDLYVGGAEHAVLHLLYARFWHKFLFDLKFVSTKEPFFKLKNVGLILASDGQKMSKSKGNIVSPDEIIEKYGADTLRVYEMFMGPFEQAIIWNEQGVKGVHKFLNRLWDFVIKNKDEKEDELFVEINKLNKKVSEDIEKMKFNTSIAFFMEFLNFAENKKANKETLKMLLLLISPFAPHLSNELSEIIGVDKNSCDKWPEYNKDIITEEKVEIVIQVDGKVRDRVETEVDSSEENVKNIALQREIIKKWTQNKEIQKTLFVSNKLINIILKK
ncbi:MAG TPA: leucine--tRNA ligase, partial [Candidatus Pacearchaeota archaeon]|nr:leucine--tRNA ligase [Candidatus Pacearchaeota archaeon]